jgi:hypothetical protein
VVPGSFVVDPPQLTAKVEPNDPSNAARIVPKRVRNIP